MMSPRNKRVANKKARNPTLQSGGSYPWLHIRITRDLFENHMDSFKRLCIHSLSISSIYYVCTKLSSSHQGFISEQTRQNSCPFYFSGEGQTVNKTNKSQDKEAKQENKAGEMVRRVTCDVASWVTEYLLRRWI